MAVVQAAVGLQFADKRAFSNLVGIEVPIPWQQVVHTAHQATAAHHIEKSGPVDAEATFFSGIVSGNAVGHDDTVVIVEERMRHAERLEDIRGGKFGKRFSGRALYHHTGKKIVRVAVDVFFSRHIVQPFLTGDQFQDIVWRRKGSGIPAREISQSQVVPEPASLVQHLP